MTFQDLGLIAPILRALTEAGYQRPSPIQERAIPPALAGRDVLGCAQTGTGKTCAFAAPILQRLSAVPRPGRRAIRALILTPTRELAIQIGESFADYGKHLALRHTVIFGGVGQSPQVEALTKGVDILVATPGRLMDLHNQGFVSLDSLEIFVLDEADRMLDMGFIHDVRKILKWLPAQKQTLFFSATMPPEITDLVNQLLHSPARVAVDPVSSPVEIIRQRLYYVDRGNKTKLLASLIREEGAKNALVFTRTKHGANKVAGDLNKAGVTAAAIHGNKSQTARQQALADFKAGRITALVATDIAARGLDIEELSHVFNYNLPEVPETYVHRIGRTGRAGRGGTAISFCDCSETSCLKDIERLIKRQIPVVEGHPWPMEQREPVVKDARGRAVNPEDAEARAAAKERRRARDAANKAAAAVRKAQAPEPPVVRASALPEVSAPKKRTGRRDQRASATLEEALTATAPRTPQTPASCSDFQRPDPLSSDVIMDATARLLAPRRSASPAPAAPAEPGSGRKRRRRKKTAQPAPAPAVPSAAPAPKKSKGKNAPARQRRPGGGRRHGPPEIRRSTQKDSTEQSSLMRPYYLSDDK